MTNKYESQFKMKIPRILHQTWRDHDIPEAFKKMALSWRNLHKDWKYVFWTDEMNRDFIKEHFSYFLPVYDSYQYPILRVDAVRYFVLYKYGGFFIDMDFECLCSIDPIVANSVCVFGKEPLEHSVIHDKNYIISNAFMGAAPGFHFFNALCEELEQNKCITDHPNDKVLETTGPFMLTRLYEQYPKKEEISLLDAHVMYPLTKEELSGLQEGPPQQHILKKLEGAYGIHYYSGTWWKK